MKELANVDSFSERKRIVCDASCATEVFTFP